MKVTQDGTIKPNTKEVEKSREGEEKREEEKQTANQMRNSCLFLKSNGPRTRTAGRNNKRRERRGERGTRSVGNVGRRDDRTTGSGMAGRCSVCRSKDF